VLLLLRLLLLLLLLQVLLSSVEVAMEYLMGLTTSPYVEWLQVRLLGHVNKCHITLMLHVIFNRSHGDGAPDKASPQAHILSGSWRDLGWGQHQKVVTSACM
jgi:hypothetical protein